MIEKAAIEARDILLKAKDEATGIIREMNHIAESASTDTIKDLNNLRNKLNDSIRTINESATNEINHGTLSASDLSKGTKVIINHLNQKGTIIDSPKNNKVLVQVGVTKLNVDMRNLSLDWTKSENKKQASATTSSTSHFKEKKISNEINLIGLNVNEAIDIVDKYLDDCYLSGLNTIRIVHGKGTGKLRQGIHTFLKKHPHVKNFRLGTFGEGEMGVTIVELKK